MRGQLDAARLEFDTAAAQVAELADRVALEPYSREQAGERARAAEAFDRTAAAVDECRANLRRAALASVPAELVARLDQCRGAGPWRIAEEFRVARRGDEQWGEVEGRLIAEARAARLGVELEPWVARPLTELRAEGECARASQDIAANLESIERLFERE